MAPEKEPSSSSQTSLLLRGLRDILFSVLGFWVGRSFSRSGSDSPNEHIDTIRYTGEAEHQQGQQNISLNVTVRETEEAIRDRRAEADRQHRIQNSIRRAAWAAFVAASIYGGIAYRQWQTQIHNMKIDNRPWIAIEGLEGHIRQPDPFFWTIPSLRNAGKSPALETVVRANYKIFPKDHVLTPSDIEFRKERRDSKEWNTYHVGAFNLLRNYWTPKFQFEEEISNEVWEQLMRGDKIFYLFFDVKYNDVFGRSLETRFCTYYLPKLERHEAFEIYNDVTPE